MAAIHRRIQLAEQVRDRLRLGAYRLHPEDIVLVRRWRAAWQRMYWGEPCHNGHYGCSTVDRGPCGNEVIGLLEHIDAEE
jgi:hypothetical protein